MTLSRPLLLWGALALPAFAGTCADGDGDACLALGEKHARGDGVPRDHPLAAKFFRKACKAKTMAGCTRLGFMFQRGFGVSKDPAAAVRLYNQACDGDDPDACALLATMYMRGEGVEASPEKAAELMERATAKARPEPKAHPEAGPTEPELEERCQAGQGVACLELGRRFAFTDDEEKADPPRGLRYFLGGCDRKEPRACTAAGLMHFHGRGTARDTKRAGELYTRACDADDPWGCHYLAIALEKGEGVARNLKRALALHDKACGGKVRRSCLRAGVMQALGEAAKPAAGAAAAFFDAGCRLEDMYACALLGVFFENGAGTGRDPKLAKRWFDTSWTHALKVLASDPKDRNLICDHAELAINLRRPHAEARRLVARCVETSTEPYQKLVAHVLDLSATVLAGDDPSPAAKAVVAALPAARKQSLGWSFKTLRIALLGRPQRDLLLPLLTALDEATPAAREAKVKPLLDKLLQTLEAPR